MTSQREIWDNRYTARVAEGLHTEPPSEFAARVAAVLKQPADVLELGCGPGWDAAYFAGQGHRVLATDFAASVVQAAKERFTGAPGLEFRVLEMPGGLADPVIMPDQSFDVVYARLSLHYFTDAATRLVFDHLARVLRPGGLLAFMCKSTYDPMYGKGVEIEPDMFESHHQRHFFSDSYARSLLGTRFDTPSVVSRSGPLYGEPSAWIEVVATRP